MNRRNHRKATPLVLQKPLRIKPAKLSCSLSQTDLKRLMVAQIVGGMMSNPRAHKIYKPNTVETAIEHAEKIIDLT